MKIKIPWRKRTKNSNFSSLEDLLAASLKPFKPRAEFVNDLRRQIIGEPARKVLGIPTKSLKTGLITVGAGASIFFLLLAGIRVAISILGALGLIQQVNKQLKEKQPASPATAV